MSLDEAIVILADDEVLEGTPLNFRISKQILSSGKSGKANKVSKEDLARTLI
jgi:GTP-binding protein